MQKRKRILVYRPDNIGDMILFSGGLKHIRNLYPSDHITLAVQEHVVNLVELCPYVDSCISSESLTWWGRLAGIKIPPVGRLTKIINVVNALWNKWFNAYDEIIFPVKSPDKVHLQTVDLLRAQKVFKIVGCHLNLPDGLQVDARKTRRDGVANFDVSSYDPWQHELITNRDFLAFLGCKVPSVEDVKPIYWLADDDIDFVSDLQKDNKLVLGLFPGASVDHKAWAPSNYSELSRGLGDKYVYVIFGGVNDMEITGRVANEIYRGNKNSKVVNLAGKTGLRDLVKSISSCDILLSMDSAALHIGISLGIATVGIVGGGHYGRFVPWGEEERNLCLSKILDCFHCNWICVREKAECIEDVTPQAVIDLINKLS